MKKSSLLALSLTSLVALVGCGKSGSSGPTKISGEKFDAELEAILEKYQDGTYALPVQAELTYEFSYKCSGYYVDVMGNKESGKGKVSFGIQLYSYQSHFYWDPIPEEDWDEEDLAEARDIVSDAYLSYQVVQQQVYFTEMFWVPVMYAGAFSSVSGLDFFKSPLGMKADQSGDFEEAELGIKGSYSLSEAWTYSKEALLTKFVSKYSESLKGISDSSISGKLSSSDTYSVKYVAAEAE